MADETKPRMIRTTIFLPEDLQKNIKEALRDPILGEPRYGAWSELVRHLLHDWYKKHVRDQRQPQKKGATK